MQEDCVSMQHSWCPNIFSDQLAILWRTYKGLEIVYDYYYYQMMLGVNNFLNKWEAVRSYWLPKQAS
jgi:hypothetical protein